MTKAALLELAGEKVGATPQAGQPCPTSLRSPESGSGVSAHSGDGQAQGFSPARYSPAQRLVLNRMSADWGYPMADIAADTGVHFNEVRSIVRGFRDAGLAEYGPLYDEDEPFMRGSGYWLSTEGFREQRALREWAAPGDAVGDFAFKAMWRRPCGPKGIAPTSSEDQ